MKAVSVFALALLLTACASVAPVPIRAGDVCFHCRRTITDPALAAEVISQQGHVFKFSSVACLSDYLQDHPQEPFKAMFVTDYARGKLFPAGDAWFVKFEVDPKLKTIDYAAFRAKDGATAFASEHGSTLADWAAVQADQGAHAGH